MKTCSGAAKKNDATVRFSLPQRKIPEKEATESSLPKSTEALLEVNTESVSSNPDHVENDSDKTATANEMNHGSPSILANDDQIKVHSEVRGPPQLVPERSVSGLRFGNHNGRD